jgi:hypothetical protein
MSAMGQTKSATFLTAVDGRETPARSLPRTFIASRSYPDDPAFVLYWCCVFCPTLVDNRLGALLDPLQLPLRCQRQHAANPGFRYPDPGCAWASQQPIDVTMLTRVAALAAPAGDSWKSLLKCLAALQQGSADKGAWVWGTGALRPLIHRWQCNYRSRAQAS